MKQDCVLCSFHEACSENTLFLYAETPILREIVKSHLERLGISFKSQNDLFRIEGDAPAAIKALQACLSAVERAEVTVSRNRGSAMLASSGLDDFSHHLDTEWFDVAVRNDSFTTFFQPIVDARYRTVFAHECLIRLFTDRAYNGGEIIEAAVSRGSVHLFDSYARRLSIRQAGAQYIPGTKIFINFMPSSIYDPAFCMASAMKEMSKTALTPKDIIFEVVESETVADVKHLQKICAYYRKEGFGFALDDVGTGSNSLQMVCDLKPDYIKLDKSLISRVSDPMYQGAVGKLTEFAIQFGLQVIAEGIETEETCETLGQLGIHLMQGYYFGRPAPQMRANLDTTATELTRIGNQLGESVKPDAVPLIQLSHP